MKDLVALGVTMRWGGAALVLLLARSGWAQECQIDDDCGHGFQCIHESGGTATVTGGVGGTASSAVCGDAICDFIEEDVESCPEDCDTIQYCAPGECSSDADCAEGYECGAEVGSNSTFTGAGGTSSSVCGDGVCDFDETNASCPDDCRLYRLCQPMQVVCMSDDDCADGFYCYLDGGANNVSVAVSSVDSTSGTDTATNGSDSATGSGGNVGSGSGGGQDSSAGFVPIPPQDSSVATDGSTAGGGTGGDTSSDTSGDATGVCLPEITDGTTGGSSGSVNNVSTVGGVTTDAGDSAGTDAGETGTSASSANGSGGATSQNSQNASVVGSGTDGSSSDGSSNGGAGDGSSTGNGDGSGSGDDGGCSCSVAGAGGWSGGLLLSLLGIAAVGGRRVRSRRRWG